MSDADLRLNSLARYRKESPELVLEEHGGCEVPAGCGGVVLRWVRRGQEQAQLRVTVDARCEPDVWLDGAPVVGSVWCRAGRHALAIYLPAVDPRAGLLQVRVEWRRPRLADRRLIASAADGTWRSSVVTPDDHAWAHTGFDDRSWVPLVARPLPEGGDPNRRWVQQWMQECGAVELGLPHDGPKPMLLEPPIPVWIRKELEVEFPLAGGSV